MSKNTGPAKPKSKKKSPYAKAIAAYYAALNELKFQNVLHEGAVSTAFGTLLAEACRTHKFTLIPQLGEKRDGREIRPDGTVKDAMYLVRGYWEAKDTKDDLEAEIAKKIKKGYPTNNVIFEDTRAAVMITSPRKQITRDKKLESMNPVGINSYRFN